MIFNLNEFFIPSDITEIVTRIQDISQKFSGKTVLITGAKGFLGRYFIEIFKQFANGKKYFIVIE